MNIISRIEIQEFSRIIVLGINHFLPGIINLIYINTGQIKILGILSQSSNHYYLLNVYQQRVFQQIDNIY